MSLWELSAAQWLDLGISAGLVLLAMALARPLVSLVLNRVLGRLAGLTRTHFDDLLIGALRPPAIVLLWLLALQAAVERLDFLPAAVSAGFADLYFVGFVLAGFLAAWRLISMGSQWYSREVAPRTTARLDEQLMPFARRVSLIVVSTVALIILLDHFGVEISALVTTLGIGSLAIALAAQAALSDTISGFVIMIDQPFRIGDRIELIDLDTWGDVLDIGLRSSRIRTRDNRMVIIPNSLIGKSMIVNHSFPDSTYRLQTQVGVAYDSDVEHVRRVLIDAVKGVDGVLPDSEVQALLLEFGDSSLNFKVRWWLPSFIDTRIMIDRVNTAIFEALRREGITIPFPQRVVHLRQGQEEPAAQDLP